LILNALLTFESGFLKNCESISLATTSRKPTRHEKETGELPDQIVAKLVIDAADGNGAAFAKLIHPYRNSLFAFLIRSCGNQMQAEDLLQETLVRIWKSLPRYTHQGRFTAWIFTIARNAIRDSIRRQPPASLVEWNEAHEPVCASTPASELEASDLATCIDAVFAKLSEEQRAVFLLRQHAGLTFREISEVLARPLGTVLSHMHRVLDRLGKEVKSHDES
jgi:RNA polymerase sigma-70 factor (ECF subfamily)